MKHTQLFSLCFLAILSACKEPQSIMETMKKLEDSVSAKYRCGDTKLEIEEYSYIHLTLNEPTLSKKTPEQKQQIATEIGQMVVGLFTGSQKLDKGDVTFANAPTNESPVQNDKGGYNMHIDSLTKLIKK
jgi:hypothetical protein